MIIHRGIPMAIHWKKLISTPTNVLMSPMPMRLGGVPIGVQIPPTDAENAVMSMMPVEKGSFCSFKDIPDGSRSG